MHAERMAYGRALDLEPVDATEIPLPELHRSLRAWVAGRAPGEAAVELLIAHDGWLRCREFLTRCVVVPDRYPGDTGPRVMSLDWSAIAHAVDPARPLQPGEALPGNAADFAVLAFAVSLVGAPLRLSLRDLVVGLDPASLRLVLTAVAHAAGWRIDTHITSSIPSVADWAGVSR